MNIETTTVRRDMEDYLKFGWKHTEDVRVRHGRRHSTEYVLARDKDMPHYRLVEMLEKQYFALKAQKKSEVEIHWDVFFILFLLLIIPGILYLLDRKGKNQEIQQKNEQIQRKMNDIAKEAAQYLR